MTHSYFATVALLKIWYTASSEGCRVHFVLFLNCVKTMLKLKSVLSLKLSSVLNNVTVKLLYLHLFDSGTTEI